MQTMSIPEQFRQQCRLLSTNRVCLELPGKDGSTLANVFGKMPGTDEELQELLDNNEAAKAQAAKWASDLTTILVMGELAAEKPDLAAVCCLCGGLLAFAFVYMTLGGHVLDLDHALSYGGAGPKPETEDQARSALLDAATALGHSITLDTALAVAYALREAVRFTPK